MIYIKRFVIPEGGSERKSVLTGAADAQWGDEEQVEQDENKKRLPGRVKHQIEHQAGLELLARGLKAEYGLSFPDLAVRLQKGRRGKPYLPEHPQIHFNISHSGCMAVCALGRQPLGVDVEQIRPVRLHTTRRMLTEREREYLERCPKERRDLEFFRIWTLKESYCKALGIGLALNFTEVECSFCGQEREEIGIRRLGERTPNEEPVWKFSQTIWEDAYVISFCGQEAPDELRWFDLDLEASD